MFPFEIGGIAVSSILLLVTSKNDQPADYPGAAGMASKLTKKQVVHVYVFLFVVYACLLGLDRTPFTPTSQNTVCRKNE